MEPRWRTGSLGVACHWDGRWEPWGLVALQGGERGGPDLVGPPSNDSTPPYTYPASKMAEALEVSPRDLPEQFSHIWHES